MSVARQLCVGMPCPCLCCGSVADGSDIDVAAARAPVDIIDIFAAPESDDDDGAADSCADTSECDWEPFGGTLWSDGESATPLEGRARKRVVTRLFVPRGCDGDASSDVPSGATTLLYGSDSSDDEAVGAWYGQCCERRVVRCDPFPGVGVDSWRSSRSGPTRRSLPVRVRSLCRAGLVL